VCRQTSSLLHNHSEASLSIHLSQEIPMYSESYSVHTVLRQLYSDMYKAGLREHSIGELSDACWVCRHWIEGCWQEDVTSKCDTFTRLSLSRSKCATFWQERSTRSVLTERLGLTHLLKYENQLLESTPVRSPLYRLSLPKMKYLRGILISF
jgi:hypothetical protein